MAEKADSLCGRAVGRYVLYGEIASGGMATVHLGRLSGRVGFSRTVAIKRLHAQFAKDPEFVTMFLDEARLAGRIRHPNVVATLDVVATEGEIFLVMEYVSGETLSNLARVMKNRGGQIPPRVAATMVSSVLHGLHAAHEAKDEQGRPLEIVHRDVSPQNVMVGTDGVARVLDFGVAKASGRLQTTREGQIKGKIAYMAPEQLSGGVIDRHCDIYSAGVVLWEALAGRRLFEGENEAVVLLKALEGEIDPPSLSNPEVPPAVDAVVLRALARDPTKRYATAKEMAIAIERSMTVASSSDVGEWVESIAGPGLHARAMRVAEIERSSSSPDLAEATAQSILSGSADEPVSGLHPSVRNVDDLGSGVSGRPRLLVTRTPLETSQVSSISVSRPALRSSSDGDAPRRSRAPKIAAAVAALVCAIGAVLLFVRLDLLHGDDGAPTADVRALGANHRGATTTTITGETLAAKAVAATTAAPPGNSKGSVAPAPHVAATAAAPAPAPAPGPSCDPPYTIDPATGRKKYKLECLQ